MQSKLTVREINALTRDGGNGRNVYVLDIDGSWRRVIAARTKAGQMQIKLLGRPRWSVVTSHDEFKVSL